MMKVIDAENGFRYCTYCGRVLQEVPYNIEDEERGE
jgi:hypothetical protein